MPLGLVKEYNNKWPECFQEIESSRLLLIPIKEEYAVEIFKNFDNEITLYMFPKPAKKNRRNI